MRGTSIFVVGRLVEHGRKGKNRVGPLKHADLWVAVVDECPHDGAEANWDGWTGGGRESGWGGCRGCKEDGEGKKRREAGDRRAAMVVIQDWGPVFFTWAQVLKRWEVQGSLASVHQNLDKLGCEVHTPISGGRCDPPTPGS